nr:hypothetical protein [Neobacillus niacini]
MVEVLAAETVELFRDSIVVTPTLMGGFGTPRKLY